MPRKTKAKAGPTRVTFLLDRSGSMGTGKQMTIDAFNEYLNGLRDVADLSFTFLQFDSQSLDKVCVAQPIKTVPALTDETYQPRASTPLIDAAYKTVKAVEAAVQPGEKVVVAIQTDGAENCSTEHTWEALSGLVKAKTAEGWQFLFMGAGIDAYAQGAQMGIAVANTVSYDRTKAETVSSAFAASSMNTRDFAMGASLNASYSAAQKSASGDRFDPDRFRASMPMKPPLSTVGLAVPLGKPLDLTTPQAAGGISGSNAPRQTVQDFSL